MSQPQQRLSNAPYGICTADFELKARIQLGGLPEASKSLVCPAQEKKSLPARPDRKRVAQEIACFRVETSSLFERRQCLDIVTGAKRQLASGLNGVGQRRSIG